jgi:hypothetical protein
LLTHNAVIEREARPKNVIVRSAATKQPPTINNAVIAREARPKQAPTIERLLCAVIALSAGGCFATLAMTFFATFAMTFFVALAMTERGKGFALLLFVPSCLRASIVN